MWFAAATAAAIVTRHSRLSGDALVTSNAALTIDCARRVARQMATSEESSLPARALAPLAAPAT